MLKETKTRIRHLAILFVTIVAAVFLAIVLARWTGAIKRDREKEELKRALRDVVDREGEMALFSLVDIPVQEILYGDEGLTVLTGDKNTWNCSFSEMQNIRVYEEVSPSVVSVTTSVVSPSPHSSLDAVPSQGAGSGFIISGEGYILTNAHVVENAESVTVGLSDQKQFPASIVGIDSEDDLAVLRINPSKGTSLKPVKLGTSEDLVVGQKVIAIGNPFGYERALTTGVVSGLRRSVRTETGKVIMDAIQSDAAMNPGNSGGPLLNAKGEVIGVNSSIFSTTGSSQGVNFAIPIDTAISLIPDLVKYGKVLRGWLDIVPVQMTGSLADYAGLSVTRGVLVSQTESGGEAEKAGLMGGTKRVRYGSSVINVGGDVITEIDGRIITGLNDYYLALLATHEGDKVKVRINRKGEEKELTVTLCARERNDVSVLVK